MKLYDLNLKPWALAYTTTVLDVYGTDNPEAPEGYEFTGEFRPPKSSEVVLSTYGPEIVVVTADWNAGPRLILKKAGPTIESVYGTPHPKIPAGYEPTGEFRPVKSGDVYMKRDGGVATSNFDEPTTAPRLILRRIPRKRVIFEATGETRQVRGGEWYEKNGMFQMYVGAWTTEHDYPIYTRCEEEF